MCRSPQLHRSAAREAHNCCCPLSSCAPGSPFPSPSPSHPDTLVHSMQIRVRAQCRALGRAWARARTHAAGRGIYSPEKSYGILHLEYCKPSKNCREGRVAVPACCRPQSIRVIRDELDLPAPATSRPASRAPSAGPPLPRRRLATATSRTRLYGALSA